MASGRCVGQRPTESLPSLEIKGQNSYCKIPKPPWQDLKRTERSLTLFNEAPSVTESLCQSTAGYASINVKPEGREGPRYVFELYCLSHSWDLTKNLGPRVGAFAFFAGRNEIKSCRPTRPDFRFVNGQCPYR